MKRAPLQQGLSLIEVMISMAIGSVVILGVLSLFTANTETYNALQAQTRLQEAANFGLNVIARDLQRTREVADNYFQQAAEKHGVCMERSTYRVARCLEI